MIIIKILILCIISIALFIISINKIRNNNDTTKSSSKTSTYKALSPQVSQNIKSCFSPKIVSIPEIEINTSLLAEIKATDLIPILKDIYYENIIYKWEILPEDINPDVNEKNICSNTSTCFSIFNNLSKKSSLLFSSPKIIIPANVLNKNMRLRLLLEVSVNNDKFTSERILNIKNYIPTIVINPSISISQDASSPITIYNSSYLNYSYPVEYNISKWLPATNLTYYYFNYNSRSKNFITSTWEFTPTNGIMVNSNRFLYPTDESLTISSYRFIPKTSNKVVATLTVKNKNEQKYLSTKTIPIYLTINLANKFDFSIVNPISTLFDPNSGQSIGTWDIYSINTYTLNVQTNEKVSSDIHPLRSDLSYNWSVIDYYSRNPININSISTNTTSSSLILTYNSNVFSTDKYVAICTITYGLYSTPVNLRFQIIIPPPPNLANKFDFSIINPNSSVDPLTGIRIDNVWDPSIRSTFTLDVRLTEKISADIPPLRTDLIYNWIVINNNSGNPINISSVAANTTSSSLTLTYNSNVFPTNSNQYTARCSITYGTSPPVNLSFIFYVVPSPINCILSDWTTCSATCGGGTQTRSITQYPNSTGTPCPPESELTRTCNTQPCPINCILGEWTPCSVTCGGGTQTRGITQYPNATGTPCPTDQSAYKRSCNTQSCTGGGTITGSD